jgi:hypothetical protein
MSSKRRPAWSSSRRSRLLALLFGVGLLTGAGTLAAPSAGAATSPAFVQQVSGRAAAASLKLTPPQAVGTGDRLVVEVGTWSSGSATAKSVTDSAGNTWTRLTTTTAPDHTELSTWTAPVTAGAGTRPTVTVTASGTADIGAALLDYTGVSTATGTAVLDTSKTATGTTAATAATVATGATTATSTGPDLAIGLYADSGFSNALTAGTGWTSRVNVSPTADMEFLAEDQTVPAGGTPNATFGTGPRTPWLTTTIVLKGS